jgi:hypothetical protein
VIQIEVADGTGSVRKSNARNFANAPLCDALKTVMEELKRLGACSANWMWTSAVPLPTIDPRQAFRIGTSMFVRQTGKPVVTSETFRSDSKSISRTAGGWVPERMPICAPPWSAIGASRSFGSSEGLTRQLARMKRSSIGM